MYIFHLYLVYSFSIICLKTLANKHVVPVIPRGNSGGIEVGLENFQIHYCSFMLITIQFIIKIFTAKPICINAIDVYNHKFFNSYLKCQHLYATGINVLFGGGGVAWGGMGMYGRW